MTTLLIGQVAERAGVGVGAVRLYERRGLLPPAPRSRAGYRQYAPEAVVQVQVIVALNRLGFSLREIRELFEGVGASGLSPATKRLILDEKLDEIDRRIRSLEHIRGLLVRLKRSRGGARQLECALAEAALKLVAEQPPPPARAAASRRRRAR